MEIDIVKILIAAGILTLLAGVFAVIIVFLGKRLSVKVDVKVQEITQLLSGANCGGCGFSGCAAFAKALAEGKAKVSECPVTSLDKKHQIEHLTGGESADEVKTVAVVSCNGGHDCLDKYEYLGYGSCQSAEILAEGRKACNVGCMGLGSCVEACMGAFAVQVSPESGVAKINGKKCISCGLCVIACPKKIIKRIPKTAKVYIACSSHNRGKDIRDVCKNGCIGCALCTKVCPERAIVMDEDLAVIDYSKCTACFKCAEKCPSKCIKRLDDAI
ncbi:MAG: RnfABCDGE type electron transport complex subunit B [Firmicutes bacterium]|nr:RnfABCDGE type electron transport complex subunit B [Bacillota bacterium]